MKSIFLLTLGLFLYLPTTAQDKDRDRDKNEIETLKIAFITDALNLSSAEAQKFWPIYNKYEDKRDLVRTDMFCNIYSKLRDINVVPAPDAEQLLDNYMDLRIQRHQLWKNYIADLRKVISAKKIMMLKKAEYEFNKRLLEKYKHGHKDKK